MTVFAFAIRADSNSLNLEPGNAEVNLVGTFNNWCGTCNPMSDPDGDGVWELRMELPTGNHEYKYVMWTLKSPLARPPSPFYSISREQVRRRRMGERRGGRSTARRLVRLPALRSVQQLRLHSQCLRREVQHSDLLLELLRNMRLSNMLHYFSSKHKK